MADGPAPDPGGSRCALVAAGEAVYRVDLSGGGVACAVEGIDARRPTCLAAWPGPGGPGWCGTEDAGVFRSVDGGVTWTCAGLEEENITAVAIDPKNRDGVWAGTEPSAIWRSEDAGRKWERRDGLLDLPSSSEWSFPPKPETHHVRWITVHPEIPGRAWIAIEAGALVSTPDGGRSWQDRVAEGPYDTHELAVHPDRPDRLHSAAGDGYYTSPDGGRGWKSPVEGLDVGYLRSVAVDPVDPSVVVVSAASHPYRAYRAGHADGRLFRREGDGAWQRVTSGWPDPPSTIAPLLAADAADGALLAADERGVHRSRDQGLTWDQVAEYPVSIDLLRGLTVIQPSSG